MARVEQGPVGRVGEESAPGPERRRLRLQVLQDVEGWLHRPDVRAVGRVFLLTRALFLLLTYFGVILFESTLHGAHPSFLHQLLPAWANSVNHGWDTEWYTDIAQRGYDWRKPSGTSPTAFFPLYPLLIHLGIAVTHRSPLLVALGISNVAFLGALLYLWRLTAWELGARTADRTILYIAVFPTALFFFSGYTESLFLLLTVGSFYHARRRDWLLAGLLGALASATRVTGVLLVIPLAYEYARDRNFSWRRLNAGVLGVLCVPLGLLAFVLYLWWAVGDPLAFTHSQLAWQKVFTLQIWSGFAASLHEILVLPHASFLQAHNVINVVLGGVFLLGTVLAARALPASYTLYNAAFWLVTLTSPAMAGGYQVPLISLSRYILALFPVFMYLGLRGARPAFHDAYLVLSTGMLALFTLQFITGGWII